MTIYTPKHITFGEFTYMINCKSPCLRGKMDLSYSGKGCTQIYLNVLVKFPFDKHSMETSVCVYTSRFPLIVPVVSVWLYQYIGSGSHNSVYVNRSMWLKWVHSQGGTIGQGVDTMDNARTFDTINTLIWLLSVCVSICVLYCITLCLFGFY